MIKKLPTYSLLLFVLFACKSDDDTPVNPIDQLPPATQTGANTFGCLVNGEVFIPSGTGLGGPVLDCVYQFVDGGYYFAVQGNRRKNGNIQRIGISTSNLQIEQAGGYLLLENEDGNAKGAWWYYPVLSFIYTSQTHTGMLNISKLDMENHIVSGTFWFNIQLPNGEIIEIREGRFDMSFTQ